MNLADPELELIDPTPNVHALFIQFDQMFFWKKLASRAVVKWSKRMYSCAGVCSYEGRGGLCNISLSEPLLKLRPRKDLVETLLHEMIHAFLFVTGGDQNRDGHGPNFKGHMHRINSAAGLNISIYHSFHEEVELYQTHWWRCDGPCHLRKPHFGIVRRSANRAPGPHDYWWADHLRKCGGTFIKFKEPEKKVKKTAPPKPKGNMGKYVTTTKNIPPVGEPKIKEPTKKTPVPKPVITKSNSSSTVLVTQATQKRITTFTDPTVKAPTVFTGKGQTIKGPRERSNSVDAAEVVRNVWANKQLTSVTSPLSSSRGGKISSINPAQKSITNNVNKSKAIKTGNSLNNMKAVKHKADDHVDSPPVKIKKIDDYFKSTATSLLKDLYGDDITIAESNNSNKLIAVHATSTTVQKLVQVACPICKLKIDENIINTHLDECLNKGIISTLTTAKETPSSKHELFNKPIKVEPSIDLTVVKNEKLLNNDAKVPKLAFKEIHNLPEIPAFKAKLQNSEGKTIKNDNGRSLNTYPITIPIIINNNIKEEPIDLDESIDWKDVMKYDIPKSQWDPPKNVTDKHVRRSDSFIVPKKERDASTSSSAFTAEDVKSEVPSIKQEHKCPCCGIVVTKAINEHLDECLAFFDSNSTEPEEGASTSFANQTIVIDDDDDDVLDESQLLNATGTKFPCPCCLQMVEHDDMNAHIDECLG